MPPPASCCWCRTSERHLAADLGRLGSLMVWVDAATGSTWSACVLGTQRTGFLTAAAAQAAALRLARAQIEEGLRRIGELAPAADASDVRAQP
jgi:ornithine cyclodeaminase/alanine dehydrogenase-like protein (mu-crystallin family)